MMKIFTWLFNKRVRELDAQLADEIFKNEQLTEQNNRLNNELYRLNISYKEMERKFESKMKSLSELREELAEQRAKTAHYVELYLDATKEKKY